MILTESRDSEWYQNDFLQESLVAFSRDTLENRSQKEKSRVVIVELGAGFELQVAAAEFFHEIVDGVVVAGNFIKEFRVLSVTGNAGSVAEKLADGAF